MKNVFVIIGDNWTKQNVVKVIEEERYRDNFYFGQNQDIEILKEKLEFCDEVWRFGNCEGILSYEYAVEKGLNLWHMGE